MKFLDQVYDKHIFQGSNRMGMFFVHFIAFICRCTPIKAVVFNYFFVLFFRLDVFVIYNDFRVVVD